MAELRTTFRGLNTELSPHRLRSGTADRSVNVDFGDGALRRRDGVDEFEDDVTGSGTALRNIFACHFADGDVYVVAKAANGTLYQEKIYAATGAAATSFSAVTGGQTHSAADAGWGFMWDDRFFYFDRAGGSKWNPDANSAVAYKAGLPRPTYGPTIAAAAGGEKDGRYHVAVAYRNSRTREMGVMSASQTGAGMPVECRVIGNTGGISVTSWSTIKAADSTYEWDEAIFLTTFGNSEWLGLASGVECYSYRFYPDTVALKTAGSAGMNKADHVLDARQLWRNAGGEPPGSLIGCYTGLQAVYGAIYDGPYATSGTTLTFTGDNNNLLLTAKNPGDLGNQVSVTVGNAAAAAVTVSGDDITLTVKNDSTTTAAALIILFNASAAAVNLATISLASGDPTGNTGLGTIPSGTVAKTYLTGGGNAGGGSRVYGRLDYSLPGFPCMVPREMTYRIGGDAKTFTPEPWIGSMTTGVSGDLVALAFGGAVIAGFTPSGTYILDGADDGRLWPMLVNAGAGCVGALAAVGTPAEVHALGYDVWQIVSRRDCRNIARDRIAPTLAAMPRAYRSLACGAYFSTRDEVWFAVVAPGATKAQRILIYDRAGDSFRWYDIACLGTRATLSTAFTGSNNDLTFTAETPGVPGNSVTVAVADGGEAGKETVTVSGSAITLTVALGSSTATQVRNAFNKSGDAVALASCALKSANDGTGTIPATMGATALAGGAGDEGITAMCELVVPDAEPAMLMATDAGRILKLPGSAGTDDGTAFATSWRGWFGQERMGDDQQLDAIRVHAGSNVSGNVRLGYRAKRTADEDIAQETKTIDKTDLVDRSAGEFTINGNIFQLEFFSPQSVTSQWEIMDLVLDIRRVAKQ